MNCVGSVYWDDFKREANIVKLSGNVYTKTERELKNMQNVKEQCLAFVLSITAAMR